jgi:hypothetical protein
MQEYRLSVYFKIQLGFSICFDGQYVLSLPFVDIRLSLKKQAKGFYFFGFYFS